MLSWVRSLLLLKDAVFNIFQIIFFSDTQLDTIDLYCNVVLGCVNLMSILALTHADKEVMMMLMMKNGDDRDGDDCDCDTID